MNQFLSPGKAGLLAVVCCGIFTLTFIGLGLVQPGYNHLRNTVSYLVMGQYGWIQTLNFLVLAVAIFCIGYGLSKSVASQYRRITFVIISFLSACVVAVAMAPVGVITNQEHLELQNLALTGKIHHVFVFSVILLLPLLFWPVVQGMKLSPVWHPYVRYTLFVVILNFVMGILWYLMASIGYLYDWKGLLQKVLVANMLVWMVIVGLQLWRLESTARHRTNAT